MTTVTASAPATRAPWPVVLTLPVAIFGLVAVTYLVAVVLPFVVNGVYVHSNPDSYSPYYDPKELWPYAGTGLLGIPLLFAGSYALGIYPIVSEFCLVPAAVVVVHAVVRAMRGSGALPRAQWIVAALSVLAATIGIAWAGSPWSDVLMAWWAD